MQKGLLRLIYFPNTRERPALPRRLPASAQSSQTQPCSEKLVTPDCRRAYGHAAKKLMTSIMNMCMDVCMDVFMDICMKMCMDTCIEMCIYVCAGVCIDMCIGTGTDMQRVARQAPLRRVCRTCLHQSRCMRLYTSLYTRPCTCAYTSLSFCLYMCPCACLYTRLYNIYTPV